MNVHHKAGRYTLVHGECLEILRKLPADKFEACVTDPPYGLGEPPPMQDVLRAWLAGEVYQPKGRGFMGKAWDAFVPGPAVWREVFRVLKPGAHLLTFGGSRTYDLIGVALRLAGFEVRDTLSWMYGTGFPKSLNVSKAIDDAAGAEREVIGRRKRDGGPAGMTEEKGWNAGPMANDDGTVVVTTPATDAARRWEGWGTALKPAWEPVILARKPLAGTVAQNVQAHGTGALNIDGCRIGEENTQRTQVGTTQVWEGGAFSGARTNGSLAGRWPANVLLDEHTAELLDAQTGESKSGVQRRPFGRGGIWSTQKGEAPAGPQYGDSGGASRFFYVAKASRAERDAGCEALPVRSAGEATDREDGADGLSSPRSGAGRTGGARNIHPTVKPLALMRWLVRLVTPPGGCVLDPFAGSASTGVAALQEGALFVGIERETEYVPIALARLEHAAAAVEFHP